VQETEARSRRRSSAAYRTARKGRDNKLRAGRYPPRTHRDNQVGAERDNLIRQGQKKIISEDQKEIIGQEQKHN
jgi:hypothetical protein